MLIENADWKIVLLSMQAYWNHTLEDFQKSTEAGTTLITSPHTELTLEALVKHCQRMD